MSTMTEDTTYNGWKNYPTWAVHLWLTNDEGLYNETLGIVRDSQDPELAHTRTSDTPRVDLADALKDWVREMIKPDDASMASDLLGYALDTVDWFELADAFLED